MVSKIWEALNLLGINFSDIGTNRQHNFNWRHSYSLWGKLSKSIFGSNRASYRAKIMNVWRSNQSKLIRLKSFPGSLEHCDSVLTLPITIQFNNLPPSFFLTYPGKLLKQSNQSINYNDLNGNKNLVDSFSTLLHPHQQGLDFIPNSSHHKPSEDNSSVASESSIICLKTQNSGNMESMSSFEFSINYNEWALISPHSNENKLKKEWTNIFSKKISEIYPYCVIQFLYHRINRNTATRNSCYFVAEANCKFKNCIRLKFSIDNIPNPKNIYFPVEVNVVGTISNQHFDNNSSFSRKLSGLERKVVADNLAQNSTSNFHYKQFTCSASLEVAKHGNLTFLKSQEVLRKVKSEYESKAD